MTESDILFEVNDKGIAIITLNRPEKYNALTRHMTMDMLPGMFEKVQTDNDIRVLIITGAGKGFCSGADVEKNLGAGLEAIKDQRSLKESPVGAFVLKMAAIRKPVIAAVNGAAAGVGLSLALMADIRIASQNAKFGVVFVRRGLMPDGACTVTLPLIVGLPKALELALSGDVIGAEEALKSGLINRLVPPENLMDESLSLAAKLAANPPIAMSFIKRALYRNVRKSVEEGLYFESWGQNVLFSTKDHKEGIQSFLEKREPRFTGE